MKEHRINELDNFIRGYYLNDNCLDLIVDFSKNVKFNNGGISINQNRSTNKKHKDSFDFPLSEYPYFQEYCAYLQKSVERYISEYEFCNSGSPWRIIQSPNIQKYDPGQAFHSFHSERNSFNEINMTRHLVFMTYLNDVSDGGETEFYYQKIKVKPEKGLTLIFPSDWTHTHRGLISNEEKLIITGWFNYVG